MTTWKISTNLDRLQVLENTLDDYLLHNYKWKAEFPDIPNRVSLEFPEEQYTEAAGIYHELYKLRISPLFRNWF